MLRALGAAPHQVRRLIAGEALIVSVVAGVLGAARRPAAGAARSSSCSPTTAPSRRASRPGTPGSRSSPRSAAAIADRAGRGLRRRPPRRAHAPGRGAARGGDRARAAGRPPARRRRARCLGGGVAMALIFKGTWAVAFAILEGMLLAAGVGLLGRALLGLPAALLARPLRALGASGLLASTSLAANRWRTAALATPIVLVAMLAGTQGVVQSSGQRDAERVTAARVTAPFVVAGRDGAPIPARTAERIAAGRRRGVARRRRSTRTTPRSARTRRGRPRASHAAAPPALDLGVRAGDLRAVRGDDVAVSRVFAETGDLQRGRHVRRAHGRHVPPHAPGRRRSTTAPPASATSSLGRRARADRARSSSAGSARARRRPACEVLTRDRVPHAASTPPGNEQAWARLDDHRPRRAVRRARADQHRGDGDGRAARRAGHDPPARRHARPRAPHGRARDAPDRRSSRSPRAPRSSRSRSTASRSASPASRSPSRCRSSPAITAGAAALGLLAALVTTRIALRTSPAKRCAIGV